MKARCQPVLALLLVGLAVRVGFDNNLMLLRDPKAVFESRKGASGQLEAATTTTDHSKEGEEESSADMQQQQAPTNATTRKIQEWSFTSPHEVCPVNITTTNGDVSSSSSSSSPWCPRLSAWQNVIPKTITKRIWLPSYPGSGSEMTRTVLQAMTGLCAEGIYHGGHCGAPGTVTCKTHFPVIYKPGEPNNPTFQGFFHPSAIMLLRNPAKAIPSFVNQQYERRMTNATHVIQAPETYWNEQRDGVAFTTFLKQWKAFVLKWHEVRRMPHNVTMYLHYEKLTNKLSGPGVLKALAEHLTKLHLGNTTTVNDEEVNCLWNQTIGKGKGGIKRKRTYEPAYNTTHRAMLLEAIRDVRGKILLSHHWRAAPPLVEILDQYLDDVTNNLRIIATATE